MRVLLDTQAILWSVLDDPSLSVRARSTIEDSANEVVISPASYWEVAIKVSLGKYSLELPDDTFWERLIAENAFAILPIEIKHTAVLASLPFPP